MATEYSDVFLQPDTEADIKENFRRVITMTGDIDESIGGIEERVEALEGRPNGVLTISAVIDESDATIAHLADETTQAAVFEAMNSVFVVVVVAGGAGVQLYYPVSGVVATSMTFKSPANDYTFTVAADSESTTITLVAPESNTPAEQTPQSGE